MACRKPGADGWIRTDADSRLVPKVRDAVHLVESEGWYWVRARGSHRQYRHRTRLGTVTIAGPLSKDLALPTWRSILKQAGIDRREH
jgi:predicted RNA binding protein YcfA (HicA-like mRNA interferase family)